MKTYKKIGGVMVPESSSIGEVVPTDLSYCGGSFASGTLLGNDAIQYPILSIAGTLAAWKTSDTEITIQETGQYQIFFLPPQTATAVARKRATVIRINGNSISSEEIAAGDNNENSSSASYTGILEAGYKLSFSTWLYGSGNQAFNAGGSFFLVRLTEKYPKVLYDATRMPQHFMGPPDTDHADPTNHITTQTGSWTVDKPGYVKCQFEALSYGSSTRRALARNGNIFYRHDLTNSAAATVVVPHIEVVPGDVITFDLTNCTNPACYYVPPLWMLPVFITGADLQSSTDPGKIDIDPNTKVMAVNGVPEADFDHPDPSVSFTGPFVTPKTGFYYININPASGTSTARLTIQGNIVAAAYGNGSWFGVIEAGKTVDRIESFSPNSNYIFYPIKWVK
jgi:hypothetical protein